MKTPKKLKIALAFFLFVLLSTQLYRPDLYIDPPTANNDQVLFNKEVDAILEKACYDCHSNQTNLRWFDQITPANWFVADHVNRGRKGLNFSDWEEMTKPQQNAKLWESVNQIIQGAMPLKSYTLLHSQAKLSSADLEILKNYVKGLAPKQVIDTAKIKEVDPENLPVDINGIAYIPDYKNWTPISSTQRVDNGTMRIIYGNAIAINAIKEHQTNPWPNGTILAKVAWDQLLDRQGNISAGAFKQVEYMIKDDKKYNSTAGWGWARFKTPTLEPYGETAMFTTECVACHLPMKDNDFVFTSPIEH